MGAVSGTFTFLPIGCHPGLIFKLHAPLLLRIGGFRRSVPAGLEVLKTFDRKQEYGGTADLYFNRERNI